MKKVLLVSILLLVFFLFGCTSQDLTLPYTNSQFVAQSTDLNYTLFKEGYYDGNFLTIDGNKLGVSVIELEKMVFDLSEENDLIKSELCKKDSSYSWCKTK